MTIKKIQIIPPDNNYGDILHPETDVSSVLLADGTTRLDAKLVDIDATLPLDSFYRQALINGNFDVWQRGTTQTSSGYGSDDRWGNSHLVSTKTHSRQEFAVGQTAVPNYPKYYSRTVFTTGGTSDSYVQKQQTIEDVRQFSASTWTLSFWAKADTAGKKLNVSLSQFMGTGGTGGGVVGSKQFILTTSWAKYTYTINFTTIAGLTLGTNHCLQLKFWFDMGSMYSMHGSTFNQSGTIDLAQVQFNYGADALDFSPKSFHQELLDCMRYYETGVFSIVYGCPASGYTFRHTITFKVQKRISPTVTLGGIYVSATGSPAVQNQQPDSFRVQTASTSAGVANEATGVWFADAEL